MNWVMTALLVLGGLMCGVNFCLSVLRYPIHRILGGSKEDYRCVSGIPVFGSLFVAASLVHFWQQPQLRGLAIVLILIDTAGLHWFVGVMLYSHYLKKQKHVQQSATAEGAQRPDEP